MPLCTCLCNHESRTQVVGTSASFVNLRFAFAARLDVMARTCMQCLLHVQQGYPGLICPLQAWLASFIEPPHQPCNPWATASTPLVTDFYTSTMKPGFTVYRAGNLTLLVDNHLSTTVQATIC